jgi:hypothetical protein
MLPHQVHAPIFPVKETLGYVRRRRASELAAAAQERLPWLLIAIVLISFHLLCEYFPINDRQRSFRTKMIRAIK